MAKFGSVRSSEHAMYCVKTAAADAIIVFWTVRGGVGREGPSASTLPAKVDLSQAALEAFPVFERRAIRLNRSLLRKTS